MQPVHVAMAAHLIGKVVPVRITEVHPNSLAAVPFEEKECA
jgi:tRNA-2-methylthio-N6-dimethylallyladenosine synthase